jgi:hypothetical protein
LESVRPPGWKRFLLLAGIVDGFGKCWLVKVLPQIELRERGGQELNDAVGAAITEISSNPRTVRSV